MILMITLNILFCKGLKKTSLKLSLFASWHGAKVSLIGTNYPYLELISMVLKMFKPIEVLLSLDRTSMQISISFISPAKHCWYSLKLTWQDNFIENHNGLQNSEKIIPPLKSMLWDLTEIAIMRQFQWIPCFHEYCNICFCGKIRKISIY